MSQTKLHKAFEDPCPAGRGDPGTVVADSDYGSSVSTSDCNNTRVCMTRSVIHEVADHTGHCRRATRQTRWRNGGIDDDSLVMNTRGLDLGELIQSDVA